MARGYSIRKAMNYYRKADGIYGLHSLACRDDDGNTVKFATIEAAEDYARAILAKGGEESDIIWYGNGARALTPKDEGYCAYCKIYLGNKYIKTIER